MKTLPSLAVGKNRNVSWRRFDHKSVVDSSGYGNTRGNDTRATVSLLVDYWRLLIGLDFMTQQAVCFRSF